MILESRESTAGLLLPARSFMATLLHPLRLIAEAPYMLGQEVRKISANRTSLFERQADLERQVLELSRIAQQSLTLKAENDRLRELLGSRPRALEHVLIASLLGLSSAPNRHEVLIDKGAQSGVQVGQAVVDAEGLFGQVTEAGRYSARVLLITDPSHAVPVEVIRNGLRSIAGGTGQIDRLALENVPVTADIRRGDLLVSSGLGGRFPPGYPVGQVQSVLVEPTRTFAQVNVKPSALLDRSRYLLVVLGGNERRAP